jgi:hypothetical protein
MCDLQRATCNVRRVPLFHVTYMLHQHHRPLPLMPAPASWRLRRQLLRSVRLPRPVVHTHTHTHPTPSSLPPCIFFRTGTKRKPSTSRSIPCVCISLTGLPSAPPPPPAPSPNQPPPLLHQVRPGVPRYRPQPLHKAASNV